MPKKRAKKSTDLERLAEAMDRLLALELSSKKVPQGKIAKSISRSKTWVNAFLKIVPKAGENNAGKTQKTRKGKQRTRPAGRKARPRRR